MPPIILIPFESVNNPIIETAPLNVVDIAIDDAIPVRARYNELAWDNVRYPEIVGKKSRL